MMFKSGTNGVAKLLQSNTDSSNSIGKLNVFEYGVLECEINK